MPGEVGCAVADHQAHHPAAGSILGAEVRTKRGSVLHERMQYLEKIDNIQSPNFADEIVSLVFTGSTASDLLYDNRWGCSGTDHLSEALLQY